jgi:Protein of unknown function (DUF3631)
MDEAGGGVTDTTCDPSPGANLLNDVRAAIMRYCILPSHHAYVAVTLWCVATHLISEFDFATRLVVRSAEKRSGKSRLLEILAVLVHNPLRAVNATVAYIFRSLSQEPPPTLLFDEADTIFGTKKVAEQNEELRGLLNAGFQRGLPFGRTVGPMHIPQEFSTFAMAALAGIGRMPETIEDRGIVLEMKRRSAVEKVEPFRSLRDGAKLEGLKERIETWAEEVRERVRDEYPQLPVEDRAADLWEPLVRVADLAGGDWPELARSAATALVDSAAEDDTARSLKLLLLADLHRLFHPEGMPALTEMHSADIVAALTAEDDSPWRDLWGKPLDQRRLASELRNYGVRPKQLRIGGKSAKGYETEPHTDRDGHSVGLSDAWQRYLPETVRNIRNEGNTPGQTVSDSETVSDSTETEDTSETPQQALDLQRHESVSDVSDVSDVPRPKLCRECSRAPVRTGSGLCDFCTNYARQQVVAARMRELGCEQREAS